MTTFNLHAEADTDSIQSAIDQLAERGDSWTMRCDRHHASVVNGIVSRFAIASRITVKTKWANGVLTATLIRIGR